MFLLNIPGFIATNLTGNCPDIFNMLKTSSCFTLTDVTMLSQTVAQTHLIWMRYDMYYRNARFLHLTYIAGELFFLHHSPTSAPEVSISVFFFFLTCSQLIFFSFRFWQQILTRVLSSWKVSGSVRASVGVSVPVDVSVKSAAHFLNKRFLLLC